MRVAIDFDETVADQAAVMLMLLNWKFPALKLTRDLSWDFFEKDPEVEKAFWDLHEMYDMTYLRRAMPPVDPYVFPVLKELQTRGHTIEIVTRNEPRGRESIRAWFFTHGIIIKVNTIGRGHGAAGRKAKLPFDIFIDDAPGLAEEMKRHPTKLLIIYDQPWNRQVPKTKNVLRAKSWLEVRDILDKIGAL